MDELLRVEDLTVALPTRSGYAKAVDGLSFAVDAGEVHGHRRGERQRQDRHRARCSGCCRTGPG